MRIIDLDAHLHEPLDRVARTNPALAADIGDPARLMEIGGDIFGVADRRIDVQLLNLQQVPADLLSFCSDHPHVDGTADAVEICERQLRDVDAHTRESSFAGAGHLIGV